MLLDRPERLDDDAPLAEQLGDLRSAQLGETAAQRHAATLVSGHVRAVWCGHHELVPLSCDRRASTAITT